MLTRSWLCVLMLLAWSARSDAQITLHQADYPASVVGNDTLKVSVYNATIPLLPALAGGVWDLSSVIDSAVVLFAYYVPSSSYQFADSNEFPFFLFSYPGDVQSSILTTGILEFGANIFDTRYGISALTFGPDDSIIIPAQYAAYSTPRTKLPFPATAGSTWGSDYQYDVNYKITVAFYSYHDTPCITRHFIAETDTVTGWGKMRVRDIGGGPSDYWHVLQVHTRTITRDSFYLNGLVMPNALLTTLGVYQGKSDTTYEQYYYRVGEVTPLAKVRFRDAGYTQPYKVITHVQRLVNLGVGDISAGNGIHAYPNPVTGNELSINIPGANGKYAWKLTDVAGRQLENGILELNNGGGRMHFASKPAEGIYFLHIKGSTGEGRAIQLEVKR